MPIRSVKTLAALLAAGLGLAGTATAQSYVAPGEARIIYDNSASIEHEGVVVQHGHPYGGAAYGETGYGEIVYDEYGRGQFRRLMPPHVPIPRTPAVYRHWYPHPPYGSPGARPTSPAPMVYTPTDTSQLGYYYQQVPRWQPHPVHGAMPQPTWYVRQQAERRHGHPRVVIERHAPTTPETDESVIDAVEPAPLDPGPASPVDPLPEPADEPAAPPQPGEPAAD